MNNKEEIKPEEKEDVYNCKRCNKQTLTVEKTEHGTIGTCSNCGYTFKETNYLSYFKDLNKYSGITAVFSIVLILITALMFGGQFGDIEQKMINADNELGTDIVDLNETISATIGIIQTDVSTAKTNINSILTRLSTAETDITNLETITADISTIKQNLTDIDKDISDLWIKVNSVTSADIISLIDTNITITYYANQTADVRYCHLDFVIEEDGLDMGEIKYAVNYPFTNISLLNWTSTVKLQTYNWTDIIYDDNYYLYWFGNDNLVGATFNLTWDISDYNTSNLSKTGVKDVLMINSVLIDSPEIWEVYV